MTDPSRNDIPGAAADAPGPKHGQSEPTDPFSVGRASVSIPTLSRVPETAEEIRRRRMMRVTVAITVLILVAAGVVAGVLLSAAADRAEAVDRAGDEGRLSAITAALAVMEGRDGEEDIALRARLLASQALEHGAIGPEPVEAELGRLDPGQPATMNALAATTYLALLRGDVAAAQREASNIVVAGTWAAEAARARALAAVALGNLESAHAEAALAVEQRPGAPRHLALLALIESWTGNVEAARAHLDEATDGSTSPLVRVTRARVLLAAHGDEGAARAEAEAVLGELEGEASVAQKAWAKLVPAVLSARDGDSEGTREAVAAASETRPPADVDFTLTAAEALLSVGATRAAAEQLALVPADRPELAGRHAQATAELSIARGELDAAEAALRSAPEDGRTELLKARIAEERDRKDAARAGYARAAEDPGTFAEASTRLAALELEAGEAQAAAERIAPVLERRPTHPRPVTVAARARLALEDPTGAMGVVSTALEAHPNEPGLLAARGRVQMATEDWQEALESLRAAIERWDDDPDLHADRARAARQVGELEEARAAFDRALELNERHRQALLGSLALAIDMGDGERAQRDLETIDDMGILSTEVMHARARHYVILGAGQRGFARVRGATRRHPGDPVLLTALGDLFRQTEDYRSAINTYGAALIADPDFADARLGRAISQIRLGAGDNAAESLNEAQALSEAQHLGPAFDARLLAARGRIHFMANRLTAAQEAATRAIALDPSCSGAHLLLADVATERNEGTAEHLRRAIAGREALPEAVARLAIAADEASEMCAMSRRYLRVDPGGRWAERMRNNVRRCR